MIEVPETFARSTVEREGGPGAAWLAELPGIVEELLGRWKCVPDGEVMHGGVGIIVPVQRPAEGAAVMKVSFPHPGNVHEPDAFAAWGGRGAVRLHERDDERFAMLLERARTSTYDGGTLLRAQALTLVRADDLRKALFRALHVFAEAAEVDRERARRWAQFHAVQSSFWGRRHGFRRARTGNRLDWLTQFVDSLAELLVDRA
ncbi:aminoglycoside phosphotransferase family protein [Streptomyces sp. NPDC007164]|uniref:aminoglycoside phosphotransferase family protein n=1 Tax=Streptomyces sp. NPDC007164 TaxID=3156918 RepID=UPI0033DD3E90